MRFTLIKIMLFTAFSFGTSVVYSQVTNTSYIPTIFPKSPNSAAFEKYGNYPVNMSSGVPDISIPLYTIESGGLKVPITLSYHASGIKVNESAGWVGLGWSLSAGGSITRTILGNRVDEDGYLHSFRSSASLHPQSSDADIDYLQKALITQTYDTRPDLFSYNVPGYSGKFIFNVNDSYNINQIPFSPVVIKNSGTTYNLKFNIKDDHGNLYLLGDSYQESTTVHTQSNISSSGVTAWMLEQMISQNRRDTVRFNYISQILHLPDQVAQSWIVEDQEQRRPQQGDGPNAPSPYSKGPAGSATTTNSSADVNEQDLQQIFFKNGRIDFKLSTTRRTDINGQPYPLDTINVFLYNYGSRKMELQKSIVFDRSYFLNQAGSPVKLKLNGIRILDKTGSVTQKYSFTYNSLGIPAPMSFARDYWGYYNGKNNNTTLIPKMQVDYMLNNTTTSTPIYIGGSDPNARDVDTTYMQAGVLTSINYPTGGHTDFTYETNRYSDVNGAHLTGGLRIKSISMYDSPTGLNPITKSYQYVKSRPAFLQFGSAGQLNYAFFLHTTTARYFDLDHYVPQALATKRVRSYLSEPSYNNSASDGNPVMYSNVVEYNGISSVNAGKTQYVFRDHDDDLMGTSATTQMPQSYDYSFARGQIVEKKEFVNQGGVYKPVQSESNTYSAFAQQQNYADVGLLIGQFKQTEGVITVAYPATQIDNDANAYPFTPISIVSGDSYKTSTTIKTYDMADTTKTTVSAVNYLFGNIIHQQVTSTTHLDSRGNTNITNTKYPADYPAGNNVLDGMIANNMQAEAIEKWDNIQTVSPVVNGVTGGQLNIFKTGSIAGTFVPSTISKLNVSSPVTDFTVSNVSSGNLNSDSRYVQMINFNLYDTKNNIVQYTPRNATPTVIMWDYLQAMPVAQINNLNTNYPDFISAYTSFEAQGNGNWNYGGTIAADANAPTGSKVYQLSTGAISTNYIGTGIKYIVSYWSNGGAATVTYANSGVNGNAIRHSNGWTYYEHIFLSSGLEKVSITGNISIDELRLYPSTSQMTTYQYSPNGLTHIGDPKNQISHFEYDPFNRLKNIKDWNGNIVKNFGYHYYDALSNP